MAANERLNRKQKRERRRKIPWTIFAALVYASFYIPVLVMILFSFNDAKRNYYWVGFTTEWYSKLFSFGNHDLWESLGYSLIIAVLATVISVIIGVLGGIGLKKFEFRGKRFINMMLFVPIVVPEIVMAVSMLIIFMIVGIKLGLGTIVIGHCTFCIPYAVIIIKGRITGDNVTLHIDDVMISNMLAGASQSTLPVLILSVNRTGITPDINALTTIMVIVMLFGMIVMNILQRIHNKKEARILEESNRRIQAARLAAEE